MSLLKLTIATTDYDHFRDFRLGLVKAEGIDHTWLTLGHHEVFARFTFNREWDVSELSFAKFMAQVTRKTRISSACRWSARGCSGSRRSTSNKKSKIKTAKDLKGKKIGSPEWAHTAAVYMRGWLNDEHGVALKDVHWYQAGANEAGRVEKVELSLPRASSSRRVSDKSLSELLAAGEIDCALIARPPTCFLQGHPDIVRLFPDYWEMEEAYYKRTKVSPIMHIICVQKPILDEKPWVARNLLIAFEESKRPAASSACSIRGVTLSGRLASDPAVCARCADIFAATRSPTASRKIARRSAVRVAHLRAGRQPTGHAKPEELLPKAS